MVTIFKMTHFGEELYVIEYSCYQDLLLCMWPQYFLGTSTVLKYIKMLTLSVKSHSTTLRSDIFVTCENAHLNLVRQLC